MKHFAFHQPADLFKSTLRCLPFSAIFLSFQNYPPAAAAGNQLPAGCRTATTKAGQTLSQKNFEIYRSVSKQSTSTIIKYMIDILKAVFLKNFWKIENFTYLCTRNETETGYHSL